MNDKICQQGNVTAHVTPPVRQGARSWNQKNQAPVAACLQKSITFAAFLSIKTWFLLLIT